MAAQSQSGNGRAVPDSVARHSIIQQAQAAAAAQSDSTGPTRHDDLLQDTDLITSSATENDQPPPAYGDIYGEIRTEKDGMSTSASVTDDGRVNIRINQLNRRLSQIFTPALSQHIQSVQNDRPPPSPYIPPSLGGEKGVLPPPSLNVVIQVVGSRGDVQPFVALGKVLKDKYGHRVRLATHPNFREFVQENGLEFFSIGGDPSKLMAFMVKNPGLMPGFRSVMSGEIGQRRSDVAEYIQGCWRSCYKAGDGLAHDEHSDSGLAAKPFTADCIIANPPSFAHIHCAEKLGIPLHMMFTMPYSPTQAFPHPLANIQSSNADPQLTNYISYAMIEVLSWQGLGDIINRFRAKCLGLDPISIFWAPGMLQRLKIPCTYCWSPALIPKPKDWGHHISISGFYLLNLASNFTPSPDLQAFLLAGPPPVYIGFGSIVLDHPNAMTELIFEAVRKTGHRVLLSKGWGGMGANELHIPDNVFMLGNVPHDWLFQHVSCVVHHGGAGTTAAGITAGRPTLIVPFFGDQPFWGAMVARAGAGPDPIPHKQLTADKLAEAIRICLKPESLERAKDLASSIAAERGSDTGAQSLHQHFEVDRLRCTLAPSRAAVWRIRRTKIKLSAFAACTLANAKLLDFHDLKLYRPQEYYVDEGPVDPISGGFTACCRAFGGMAMGLADFPSETLKAVQLPFMSGRQQSRESVSTIAEGSESSDVEKRSALRDSPASSRVSVNEPEALTHMRSPFNLGATSQRSARSPNDPPGQDRNMLRQTGAHGSKGFGRMIKAAVQAPMDISVSMTKGFHNAPKLWGDDTVRPQERVSDFKSGMKAVGKEFGFGMYDGVTGLVTQPWTGAKKDGVSGFFKGFGKGIGGFATKPNAALMSVLGYTMKGVHKEVQKLYGSSVQTYIITSRTAQGYEEWLQSSNAEKDDVITRWNLIRKYVKTKNSPDEMMQDVLDAQRRKTTENEVIHQSHERIATLAQSANSEGTLTPNTVPPISRGAETMDGNNPISVLDTLQGDEEGIAAEDRATQELASQLQRQRPQDAFSQADQESLRQAIVSSKAEAQRHAIEALEHEKQLELVLAQSLEEQRPKAGDSEWELDMDSHDIGNENVERTGKEPKKLTIKAAAVANEPLSAHPHAAYDQGHLEGTTRSVFDTQQQGQQTEKTPQAKMEEDIVLEYVKKQSLLEAHYYNKGKGRAIAMDECENDDGSTPAAKRATVFAR